MNKHSVLLLCGLIIIMHEFHFLHALVKMTKFECKSYNPVVKFTKCRVEVLNRTATAGFVGVDPGHKMTHILFNLTVVKKANTWKKFLYEFQNFDACSFLQNTKRNSVMDFLYGYLRKFSNLNHTCPYEGYIFVDRFMIVDEDTKILPIPLGEYGVRISFLTNHQYKFDVNGYLSYTDYRKDW